MKSSVILNIFGILLTIGHNIIVVYSNTISCNFTVSDPTLCERDKFCRENDTCPDSAKCCCSNGYDEAIEVKKNQSVEYYLIKCSDRDECENTPCAGNMTCENTIGSYKCRCSDGYISISSTCVDKNECNETKNICGHNAKCENTVGSYKCNCLDGYRSISNTCVECYANTTQNTESCTNKNQKDPFCSLVEASFQSAKTFCQIKNITKEKAEEELKETTKKFSQALANDSAITEHRPKGRIVTEILRNVEQTVLFSFLDSPRTQQINTTTLDITMKPSRDICRPNVQSFTLVLANNSMEVPCSLMPTDKGGAVFIAYKGGNSIFNENILITPQVSGENIQAVINSKVVTGAITISNSQNLSSPVVFRLSHLQPLKPLTEFVCVYWDPARNGWSDDGCETGQSDNRHTYCSCTHLSSFALLMTPQTIPFLQEAFALTLLSYIGLSVSIVCLCLSLLTFILCRSLRNSHTSILIALCGCLFLGQLLFLVGISQTWNKILCAFIAGWLQFLFLSAFCWMSIEAFLLFMTVRNLRAVNYMASRKSNFPVMSFFGFGVPTVIVGISAAICPHDYGTTSHCWLGLHIIWSFLGPVCVFIIANTILLVLTVYLLRKRLASVNTNVSTLNNTRLLTFKAVAQLFILGCTWGIGFFQFGYYAVVFSYLFTIFNSFQGFYIFLVHCLLNQQVREVYCRLIYRVGVHKKRDTSTTSTLQTISKDEPFFIFIIQLGRFVPVILDKSVENITGQESTYSNKNIIKCSNIVTNCVFLRTFSLKKNLPDKETDSKVNITRNEENRSCRKVVINGTVCDGNRKCPINNECANVSACPCMDGYELIEFKVPIPTTVCEDISECAKNLHVCGMHSNCYNTAGGYYCTCENGYRRGNITKFCPSENKKENDCTDINECSENPNICGPNRTCTNTGGSYKCDCNRGFQNVYNQCIVIECLPKDIQGGYLDSCHNQTTKVPFCSVLEISFRSLNKSCQVNNISKEKAEDELEEIAKKFSQASANASDITKQEPKGQFITEFLHNMEQIVLLSFLNAPRTQKINTTYLDIIMNPSHDICHPDVPSFTLLLADNSMEVPCSLMPKDRGGAIFITYKEMNSILNGKKLLSQVPEQDMKTVINSKVVTGAITNRNSQNLSSPVVFKLSHLQPSIPHNRFVCVFWDTVRNGWSDEGCETGQSDDMQTTCSCTHLSSFAILMAPQTIQEGFALTLLSYIGLSVSIVCLCLSLLTFILCRSLRNSHTSILIALCGCLFLGQLLFLVGIRQTWNKLLCAFIAGWLQFLFLSAFCWMSIEGFLLFMTVRNLRAVNYMASRKSNSPAMSLLGFGIAALIVGISAAIYPHDYGTTLHCWLNLDIVWSFLGPVCVFIIINTVLLVLTVHLLKKRLASVNTNVSTLKNTRLLTFKAVAQLFILGCTWGIGYFQFGDHAVVFSYLFIVFNSLQGLYIFLVHCLLNQQVREVYCRLLNRVCIHKKKKHDTTTDSFPITSKDSNLMDLKKTTVNTDNSLLEMKEQNL
ncbi:uncharacterized protein [Pyxicephalus adspersus]|uniref:uncharacterized protein n=1 Tax=Pyxicephalus adspersus TaxID=30357 RepID=UPI003B5C6BC5